MKLIKDILRSPGFMREVSILLFGFAAIGAVLAVILLTLASPDEDALASGVGMLVQSVVYALLGILIRRGSVIALWITGVLFTLDTLLVFTLPSGKGLGAMVVTRGILIYVLVRYVRRQQRMA